MSQDGPPLLRPIPRRPFDLHFTSPTPPDEDSRPTTPAPPEFANPRFLNPTPDPIRSSSALSRPQSFLNLTSSALYGIYSATASGRSRGFGDPLDADTPWGTGAQTPVRRPSIDEATFEFMKDRSHVHRRRSSFRPHEKVHVSAASSNTVLSLSLRVMLLFCLGVGYGVLVTTQFRSGGSLSHEIIRRQEFNPLHLAFWGVSGVVLGGLLPWFDRVWENSFGGGEEGEVVLEKDGASAEEPGPGTDWALVVRAIGAFVGILFAIRKVAWASTLQVSLTLALANPLLWWLIDRSKPGLLLSAIVGLTGSILVLGVNPDMMPAPSAAPIQNATSPVSAPIDETYPFGRLARQETLEAGIWILSILFSSCVCFGNIGRRLALGSPTVAKGRWAGTR